MTEKEWEGCHEPWRLLTLLERRASERKLRLFGIACCRENWDLFTDPRLRRAVDVAEAFLHGLVDEFTRARVEKAALDAHEEDLEKDDEVSCPAHPVLSLISTLPYTTADASARAAGIVYAVSTQSGHLQEIEVELGRDLSTFIRDIFGNPFRPIAVEPGWLTSTVVALARGVYEERAFDRLPILADALQDAGCENEDILVHCRSEGPHVRGCWVVDLVLGKS